MIATLTRASIEGAVLVGVVWTLARLLRVSPAARTALWWCAAAKFIIAFVWTAPIEIPALPTQPTAVVATVERVITRVVSDENAPAKTLRRETPVAASGLGLATRAANGVRDWSSVAAIGWLLGLTAFAIAALRRWRVTERMLRESKPAPSFVAAEAAELATRVGLRRAPDIRVSASVEIPLVTGLLRPVVLLPADRFDALSDEQRRMAICHELAHVKRADLWLGCVPALAERMFFFHPLAHVASREYALAREAACDRSVMRTLDAAPQDYGRLLLVLGISPSRRGLTAAGAASSFHNLKRRISMLQDMSVGSKRSRLLAAVTVGLAVAALAPLRLVARPSPAQNMASGARSASVDERRDSAAAQVQKDQQAVKSERRRHESAAVRFVLLSADGSRTTNAEESGDVERAERQRRNGEELLWFRIDGKEYVIRDPDVLREARAIWTSVYHHHPHFDADAVHGLTHSLESLKLDDLVEQSAVLAQSVADIAIVDQAHLITEQATEAAETGLMMAEEALRGLRQGGLTMSPIDEATLDQHLHSIDPPALEEHMRALERSSDHLDQQIEHGMRGFDHHLNQDLDQRMKDLDNHVRDLDFAHLGDVGRSASDAARNATEEMRALIDRAIRNGRATPVR